MAYFAKKKIKCLGYDINKEKIEKINAGILPMPKLKEWFGFDIKDVVKNKFLKGTHNYKDLINKDCIVHFIAIPTEKEGEPYFDILFDVLLKIIELKELRSKLKPVVIVESTLTPQFSEKKIILFFKKKNIKNNTRKIFMIISLLIIFKNIYKKNV